MKIGYNVATQAVTIEATPREIGELTPELVRGLVKLAVDAIKDVRAALPDVEWNRPVAP